MANGKGSDFTPKGKDNKQNLSFSISGYTWVVSGGKLVLQLRLAMNIPPFLRGETPKISGTAYSAAFSQDAAQEGTIVPVEITDLSAQPRVEATLEVGGHTAVTSKDIPFSPPTNAVSVDLIVNVFERRQGEVVDKMLAVGVQLSTTSRPVPGFPVKITCEGFFEQPTITDSKGRCEVSFGPIVDNRTYVITVFTAQTGELRHTINVPKQIPAMEYRIVDVSKPDNSGFKVSCAVWKKDTGEAVTDLLVTVRCRGVSKSKNTNAHGNVNLGPFNFDPNSRLTKYTVFLKDFPPKECTIKRPQTVS